MNPTQDDTIPVKRPHRWRTRVRWATGAVALVGVALTVLVWWGSPRLGAGSVVASGAGMSWADDGVTTTRMVMRGRPVTTARATLSIRNDGHLPFTVRGLDVTGTIAWLARQQVAFGPGASDLDEGTAPQDQVTLNPGDEATVLWSLDMACQPILSEGASMSIEALRFEVSWLGVGTVRELALERPITFVGDSTPQPLPGTDCAGDQGRGHD